MTKEMRAWQNMCPIELRARRLGKTVQDLATEIDCSSTTIGNWKTGKCGMRAEHLLLLSNALETTADTLGTEILEWLDSRPVGEDDEDEFNQE